jgi:hypothetical protein
MTVSQVPLQGAATGAQPVLQGAEQQWLVFLPKQPPASAEAARQLASTSDRIKRMLEHSYGAEGQSLRDQRRAAGTIRRSLPRTDVLMSCWKNLAGCFRPNVGSADPDLGGRAESFVHSLQAA